MSATIKSKVKTITTSKYTLALTGKDIVMLLRGEFTAVPEVPMPDVPANAKVSFHVPGGGDWSHVDVSIDSETPIYVEWETTEQNQFGS